MESREIVIVGAGPAGAVAATRLSLLGHDVLLLDRREFPRDKACGDAIPAGAIAILTRLGMAEALQQAEQDGAFHRINSIRVVSPKGRSFEMPLWMDEGGINMGYIAPRIRLDALIQSHAVNSGVEFRIAHVVGPLLRNGRVVGVKISSNGQSLQIEAKLVIGADGVASSMARAIRQKKHLPAHTGIALRAYVDGIRVHPNCAEFYLRRELLPGYAWIFPLGTDKANIGIGMRLDLFKQRPTRTQLMEMLKDFLSSDDVKQRQVTSDIGIHSMSTWTLNFGSQKGVRLAGEGLILVGDAAGFVNPLTGGGIQNALTSALLAADSAHTMVRSGSKSIPSAHRYERMCNRIILRKLRRSYVVHQLLSKAPWIVDPLVNIVASNIELTRKLIKSKNRVLSLLTGIGSENESNRFAFIQRGLTAHNRSSNDTRFY